MLNGLWLVPALPLAGFAMLALWGVRMPRRLAALIGVAPVGLSALVAILIARSFIVQPPANGAFSQTLWTWFDVAGLRAPIGFHLDNLSLVMILAVTAVSFLILLYSVEYMAGDEGYGRFFAYMNLFVAFMLILVLADNLLLLYLGWEGVGLCSYLLIGSWYRDPANGRAAIKAFVVTRVGDAALLAGVFLIFTSLGTLGIQEMMTRATALWVPGSGTVTAAAALLLIGALGKSAQLPLQTWLPDAMAGPTPVSALIHAATMVTAGVYLIARTHALLALAPAVQTAAAVIGAATLLYAGFSALVQTDVKRMLAYSTISQVGYMFLALGVGAWSAAIFHFMTHAFFKALLFMAAGVVILRLRHEQNMLRMGGLRKELPGAFWAFLIGAASLSALPLVTAGFYSKDLILSRAWTPASGSPWLWGAGLAGALLTSLYAFRAVFLIFFGEAKQRPEGRTGLCMEIPLTALSVLAIAGGWINVPAFLRGNGGRTAGWLGYCPGVVSVIGILAAWHLFLRRADATRKLTETPLSAALENFWLNGWGFDWAYDRLFVRPFVWLARVNRDDFVDAFTTWVAGLFSALHGLLSATQTGRLRWYAVAIVIGAILILGIVTLL